MLQEDLRVPSNFSCLTVYYYFADLYVRHFPCTVFPRRLASCGRQLSQPGRSSCLGVFPLRFFVVCTVYVLGLCVCLPCFRSRALLFMSLCELEVSFLIPFWTCRRFIVGPSSLAAFHLAIIRGAVLPYPSPTLISKYHHVDHWSLSSQFLHVISQPSSSDSQFWSPAYPELTLGCSFLPLITRILLCPSPGPNVFCRISSPLFDHVP